MNRSGAPLQAPATPGVQCFPGVVGAIAGRVGGTRANAATFAIAALAIFALKAFYARASAGELGFVLAPTAALVELLSGVVFEAEAGVGYLSRDPAYLIAPACAGLNYTIAAFATLVLGFAPRLEGPRARAAGLVAFAAVALAVTPVVNALRIALDLEIRTAELPAWLSHAQAHRFEGIVLYLGSLWALSAAVQRGFGQRSLRWGGVLVPVAAYLGVTVLVPLLNGAGERDLFWDHARVVLVASFALTALAAVAALIRRRGAAARDRPNSS